MTRSAIDVRPCTADDLAVLQSAWQVPDRIHEEHFERQESGATLFLVAWQLENPWGSCVVRWPGLADDRNHGRHEEAELCHLQVRLDARRQGVGRWLVETAKQRVAARGLRRLTVGVAEDNDAATALYLQLGFVPTGEFERSEYDWFDEAGQKQHAIELNEVLVSHLDGLHEPDSNTGSRRDEV